VPSDSQTPEMGWCPEKQHNSEGYRNRAEPGVNHCGACQYGKTAGSTTDYNIHPGPAFEPYGIDDGVEKSAQKYVHGGDAIEYEASASYSY